jgi:hypothetical protein
MDELTDIPELYSDHADTYQRLVRSLGYPQGLRAVFLKSPALVPDMRILDAGCGTGITTLALRQALEDSGFSDVSFGRFPFPYWYLDSWGHVVTARAAPGTLRCSVEVDSKR